MFYKNYGVITRNDTNTEEVRTNFDDYFYGNDYIIIDIDLTSTYIGRTICDDLKEDGEYCDEDIFARVESLSDSIRNTLFGKVEEYLENNFDGKKI